MFTRFYQSSTLFFLNVLSLPRFALLSNRFLLTNFDGLVLTRGLGIISALLIRDANLDRATSRFLIWLLYLSTLITI